MSIHPPNGIVLSAGLGTRLRPLTLEVPKPLVSVCGRPILEWSLDALSQVSISHVGVNTYYLAEQIKDALKHRSERFIWSHETELQGTGGGVRDLLKKLPKRTDTVVLNGDAFFDFSLADLLATHQQNQGWVTLALKKTTADDPFGRVGVNAQGQVVRIAEVKGPLSHTETELYAFVGAQVIQSHILDYLPDGECDLFRTAYKTLLQKEIPIYAHAIDPQSIWVDVGTPYRYLSAHQALLDAPHSPLWQYLPSYEVLIQDHTSQSWIQKPLNLTTTQKIKAVKFQGSTIDPSLSLDQNVWIGAHSHISGSGQVHSCVFWNHSSQNITDPLSHHIFTHQRQLEVDFMSNENAK